jgi:intraflagellar transport protein 46
MSSQAVSPSHPSASPVPAAAAAGKQAMGASANNNAANNARPAAANANANAGAGAGGGARVQGSLTKPAEESDDEDEELEEDEEDDGSELSSGGSPQYSAGGGSAGGGGSAAGGGGANGNTPVYNPDDYAFILPKVSMEIRDLFGYITAFQPTVIECPTKLRPFVPDFIPCIGDIDAFCKIPPPDGKPDNLGLVVLDEPSCPQSNATVVKNAVRSSLKISIGPPVVDSVEEAHARGAVLDRWIADIKNIRKPQTNVNYSKPMPDITQLLQEWPPEFEAALSVSDLALPPPNIDLDIFQYVRMLCSLVDIPTHANLVESLHLMFSVYLDFRANQHFQHA